jgi:hypothetical protein
MRSQTDKRVRPFQRGRTKVPFTSALLAIALAFNGAGSTLHAQEPPENDPVQSAEQMRAAKVKADVTRRGVGHKAGVRVRLRGKHELKGHITRIDEDSFQMLVDQGGLDAQSAQDRLITIRFSEVEKIRGPESRVVNIATDVGLTAVLLVVLAVIVAAEIVKHNHRY